MEKADAERRAVESVMSKYEGEGERQKPTEKRRSRMDPSRSMDVGALVRAADDIKLESAKAGEDEGEELDRRVKERFQQIRRELMDHSDDSSVSSRERFEMPHGYPLPSWAQDVADQRALDKRFREGKMSSDQFLALLRNDLRDRGEIVRDVDGSVFREKGMPQKGTLSTPMDDVYPPEDLMQEVIMQMVRNHIRNCRNASCKQEIGHSPESERWFEDRIGALTYWEQLRFYREWGESQKRFIQLENGHEPWTHRQLGGNDPNWYADGAVRASPAFPRQHADTDAHVSMPSCNTF